MFLSASLGPGARITLVGVQILHGEGSEVRDLQTIIMSVPRVRGGHSNSALCRMPSRLGCCLQEKEGGAGWRFSNPHSTSISTPFSVFASMNQKQHQEFDRTPPSRHMNHLAFLSYPQITLDDMTVAWTT